MKLERIKNTKRNMVYAVLFRLLNTIFPFINRTILLTVLGVEYLGLNSLFASILGVLSLAELGFGTAIIYCMYKPIVEDDTDTVCALLELYKKIYRWIGLIILAVGICISPFLDKFISGDVPTDINIRLVFFIQLVNTVLSYFFFAYKSSVLSAYQREDVVSKVASWTLVLQSLLQFAVLFVTHNYYVYLIIIPFITLFRNIIIYWLASRMFPLCNKKTDKQLDAETKQEITTKVKALFIHKVGGVITNSLDSVVVSAFFGLSATAIYNNYWYILSSVGNTIAIFYTSILAGIGNSVASENEEKNYEKFNKLTFLNNWVVGWCSICMLCLYQPFMKVWVGEEYLLPFHTTVFFVVCFYVNLIRRINVTFKDACGIWVEDRFKPLISGLVNVALNLILIQLIGMDGVIVSTIISLALVEVPWEVYALFKSYFKRTKKVYYKKLFISTGIITAIAVMTYLITSLITSTCFRNDIAILLVAGIICAVFPNILFYMVWRKQFRFIKTYLKR